MLILMSLPTQIEIVELNYIYLFFKLQQVGQVTKKLPVKQLIEVLLSFELMSIMSNNLLAYVPFIHLMRE